MNREESVVDEKDEKLFCSRVLSKAKWNAGHK